MINVGEYIRTADGIIEKIKTFDMQTNIFVDEKGKLQKWMGETVFGDTVSDEITKHSKDIIDLIEVGDFIKLRFFADTYDDDSEEVETYCKLENRHTVNQIKENIKANYCEILSILTHEMYEQNCYKVGEE